MKKYFPLALLFIGALIFLTGQAIAFDTVAKYYATVPPLGLDAQAMPLLTDKNGRLISVLGPNATEWSYPATASGIVNTTTAVTIKTAAGSGFRNCLTEFDIATDGALGAATELVIRNGAAGTVMWRMKLSTAGLPGGREVALTQPLCGSANTLLEVATLTASVTGAVYFNAMGFTSP